MILDQIYIATCLKFFPYPLLWPFQRSCHNWRVDYIDSGLGPGHSKTKLCSDCSVLLPVIFSLKSQLLCTTFGLPGKPDYYLFMFYQHFAYVYSFICVNDLWVFSLFKTFLFLFVNFSCTGSLLLCVGFPLAGEHRGCSVVVGARLLTVVASRNTEHRLSCEAPVSCSTEVLWLTSCRVRAGSYGA